MYIHTVSYSSTFMATPSLISQSVDTKTESLYQSYPLSFHLACMLFVAFKRYMKTSPQYLPFLVAENTDMQREICKPQPVKKKQKKNTLTSLIAKHHLHHPSQFIRGSSEYAAALS